MEMLLVKGYHVEPFDRNKCLLTAKGGRAAYVNLAFIGFRTSVSTLEIWQNSRKYVHI
jgi:hypothetical protein